MSELETRIQEAFNTLAMPPELKAQTLHYIKDTQTVENAADGIDKTRPPSLEEEAQDQQSLISGSAWQPKIVHGCASHGGSVRKQPSFMGRLGLAFVACLLLCAIGIGGFRAYTTETAFVDIDVNPSIELGVNMFDIVVSAKPLNEDGAQVLSQIDLVGKRYTAAMDTLLESSAFLTYIDDTSFVGVSVVSDDEHQSATLTTECEQRLAKLPCSSVCGQATHEEHEAAVDEGMGMSRYRAALELIRLDPTVTMEECRAMTMHELRTRIAGLDPDNAYATHGAGHRQDVEGDQDAGNKHGRKTTH